MAEANRYCIDRLVKTGLWMKGGYKIHVDDADIYAYLQSVCCKDGAREFDRGFMSDIFEKPFEILLTDKAPESRDCPKPMDGHLEGCRIGFDAGGSDRKVSAVIDGETVFSEEVVWLPKIHLTLPDEKFRRVGQSMAAASLPEILQAKKSI